MYERLFFIYCISIFGSVNFTFFNNITPEKQTIYMANYRLAGMSVPEILLGAIAYKSNDPDKSNDLTDNQIAHFATAQGDIAYVTFMFHDVAKSVANQSEIIYPGFQSGGIINARDLPKDGTVDTTHEYILLEINLSVPALGGDVYAGYAYFYNHNYKPAN